MQQGVEWNLLMQLIAGRDDYRWVVDTQHSVEGRLRSDINLAKVFALRIRNMKLRCVTAFQFPSRYVPGKLP